VRGRRRRRQVAPLRREFADGERTETVGRPSDPFRSRNTWRLESLHESKPRWIWAIPTVPLAISSGETGTVGIEKHIEAEIIPRLFTPQSMFPKIALPASCVIGRFHRLGFPTCNQSTYRQCGGQLDQRVKVIRHHDRPDDRPVSLRLPLSEHRLNKATISWWLHPWHTILCHQSEKIHRTLGRNSPKMEALRQPVTALGCRCVTIGSRHPANPANATVPSSHVESLQRDYTTSGRGTPRVRAERSAQSISSRGPIGNKLTLYGDADGWRMPRAQASCAPTNHGLWSIGSPGSW